MGLLPILAYLIAFPATTLSDLGLSIDTFFATVIWTIGQGAVMVFLVWNLARRPAAFASYPQMRAKHWTHRMMARHLFGSGLCMACSRQKSTASGFLRKNPNSDAAF